MNAGQAPGKAPETIAKALLSLQQDSPLLLALFDEQDVLRHANTAFCQAYKTAPDGQLRWTDIMRANHAHGQGAVIEADDIEAWLAAASARRGKQAYRAFEIDLWDGRWIWITETQHANGWLMCVGADITGLRPDSRALRQAHAKALRASLTDALTGLSNRRHAMQLLQQALSEGESWPMCVVMLDLDQFKPVNDELGHAAGDLLICDFARHLQASIRREDGCGRIGGDEFVLILPTAGRGQAGAIIERLLARVRLARPLPEHPQRGYSCSAGLAEAQWGETAEALLQRADMALYRAKAEGRDRLVCAE
jgi:diguanylate cyclase (GGDEF)-like protein